MASFWSSDPLTCDKSSLVLTTPLGQSTFCLDNSSKMQKIFFFPKLSWDLFFWTFYTLVLLLTFELPTHTKTTPFYVSLVCGYQKTNFAFISASVLWFSLHWKKHFGCFLWNVMIPNWHWKMAAASFHCVSLLAFVISFSSGFLLAFQNLLTFLWIFFFFLILTPSISVFLGAHLQPLPCSLKGPWVQYPVFWLQLSSTN